MKIASVGCDRNGFPALLRFLETFPDYGMDLISVPCLGVVSEGMMLAILEQGYQHLLLAGCPLESCFNQKGSEFAARKVQRLNVLLKEAGIARKAACAFVTAEKVGEIKRVVENLTLDERGERQ